VQGGAECCRVLQSVAVWCRVVFWRNAFAFVNTRVSCAYTCVYVFVHVITKHIQIHMHVYKYMYTYIHTTDTCVVTHTCDLGVPMSWQMCCHTLVWSNTLAFVMGTVPLSYMHCASVAGCCRVLQGVARCCRVLQGVPETRGSPNVVAMRGIQHIRFCYGYCTTWQSPWVFWSNTQWFSLVEYILSFIGLFCKRDLSFAFVMGTVPRDRVHSTGVRNGVATISRLLKITGLCGRIHSLL